MDYEYEIFSKMSNLSIRKEIDTYEYGKLYDLLGSDITLKNAKCTKMQPYIANACIKAKRDERIWRTIYEEYKTRNEKVITGVDYIYRELHKNGVDKIFLSENFGALLSAGGDIGLFASGDVDNCADISQNTIISETMKALGFHEEKRYTGNLFVNAEYTNPDVLPGNFRFGIQWEPLARLKLPSFVHFDDFVNWQNMRCFSGTSIMLPPIDALMYICLLHISLHSFCRAPAVRLYRDLVNCSSNITKKDWENIINWTKSYRTNTRVSTAAYIGKEIANLSVPKVIIRNANKRLLKLVFDETRGVLKEEPGKLKILAIELYCNDSSVIGGINDILFPNDGWMEKVYGKSVIPNRIKHLKDII